MYDNENGKNKIQWFWITAMWIAVSAAIISGIMKTGSLWALWAFIIPWGVTEEALD